MSMRRSEADKQTCEGCQHEDQMRSKEPCMSCSVARVSHWQEDRPPSSHIPCRTCLHGRSCQATNYYCNSCCHRFESKWEPPEPTPERRISKTIETMTAEDCELTAAAAGLCIGYMFAPARQSPMKYQGTVKDASGEIEYIGIWHKTPKEALSLALALAANREHRLKEDRVILGTTGLWPG